MKPKKSPLRKQEAAETATLSLRIQPRASKNEVLCMEGGGFKVRLTAPPVDGAANEALVKFLADRCNIARAQVEIVSGHTGREKVLRFTGLSKEEAERLLLSKDK